MEVLIGRTLPIDDREFNSAAADRDASWRSQFGLRREIDDSAADASNLGLGFGFSNRRSGRSEVDKSVSPPSPLSSSSSSSIGALSDGDEDEVQSEARSGLSSMDSLEDSLPIKKGLSNHFAGKSKSFTNLSAVGSVEDLRKVENPINKRRRTLMASKWARKVSKASFYGWSSHPTSMPLLALPEDDDDNDVLTPSPREHGHGHVNETRRMRSFKSPSCFCLTDLQEEEEDDDDE